MSKKFPGCVCDSWCRVDHTPEQMKSKHHRDCAAHKDRIDVVKVTDGPGGNAYFDNDITNALLCMVPEIHDDEEYTVTFTTMTAAEYDDLPEFQGF